MQQPPHKAKPAILNSHTQNQNKNMESKKKVCNQKFTIMLIVDSVNSTEARTPVATGVLETGVLVQTRKQGFLDISSALRPT
jgi:hypothetical protein